MSISSFNSVHKRVEYLDIAKGIGIILVVWAHARGPASSYIYQFHMPFFFLISGLLYNDRDSLKSFTIKKIKGLYIPFAFWNLIIYTAKALYLDIWKVFILKNDFKILLTIYKDGDFLGASWFLGALFLFSVVYKLTDTILNDCRHRDYLLLVFYGVVAVVCIHVTLPFMMSRTWICGFYFAIGVFVKRNSARLVRFQSGITAVLSALIFIIIGHYNSASMGSNQYRFPFLFLIDAVLASYALLYLCQVFEKYGAPVIKNILIYLGQKSKDIVLWQFCAFKVIILIEMYINQETVTYASLMAHYPMYDAVSDHGRWLIYILAGLILPVLFCNLLRSGSWGKILKKIYIV